MFSQSAQLAPTWSTFVNLQELSIGSRILCALTDSALDLPHLAHIRILVIASLQGADKPLQNARALRSLEIEYGYSGRYEDALSKALEATAHRVQVLHLIVPWRVVRDIDWAIVATRAVMSTLALTCCDFRDWMPLVALLSLRHIIAHVMSLDGLNRLAHDLPTLPTQVETLTVTTSDQWSCALILPPALSILTWNGRIAELNAAQATSLHTFKTTSILSIADLQALLALRTLRCLSLALSRHCVIASTALLFECEHLDRLHLTALNPLVGMARPSPLRVRQLLVSGFSFELVPGSWVRNGRNYVTHRISQSTGA